MSLNPQMPRFAFPFLIGALCLMPAFAGLSAQSAVEATQPRPVPEHMAPPRARVAGLMRLAGEALTAGDSAGFARHAAPLGEMGQALVEWQFLRGTQNSDLSRVSAFLARHPGWPDAPQIQRRGEALLARAAPSDVAAFFALRDPVSPAGRMALALASPGAVGAGIAARIWAEDPISAEDEAALAGAFPDTVRGGVFERALVMLAGGHLADAERLLPRLGAGEAALVRARVALQANRDGVNALVAAVPAALQDDPGLMLDRFRFRIRAGNLEGAAEILDGRPAARLGDPAEWAPGRVRLVRDAIGRGEAELALRLASNHGLDDGVQFVDLEFLAGHVALRRLNRPAEARSHFARLRERVSSPISLARGGYWEGLALEAMGQADEARAAFAFAARHQTAYYGQLAAERLGQSFDAALLQPAPNPDWRATSLAGNDLMSASIFLYDAGHWYDARRFVLHLARRLQTPEELGALADFWLARGEPNYAVNIAKHAVGMGHILMPAYFPLTGLERAALAVPPDLVMAIARRESEFDPRVVSHADARGLLQVLPGTGELTARRLGVPFDARRLTTDPIFNATLGAAYLQGLSEEFGALSLVAAGYNAGPGRPRRWVTEFGDPRDARTDPVDWVEAIPFAETRNYVMRVLESVTLYRAILGGDARIALTPLLTGR